MAPEMRKEVLDVENGVTNQSKPHLISNFGLFG
jgi:hypothetical protein